MSVSGAGRDVYALACLRAVAEATVKDGPHSWAPGRWEAARAVVDACRTAKRLKLTDPAVVVQLLAGNRPAADLALEFLAGCLAGWEPEDLEAHRREIAERAAELLG